LQFRASAGTDRTRTHARTHVTRSSSQISFSRCHCSLDLLCMFLLWSNPPKRIPWRLCGLEESQCTGSRGTWLSTFHEGQFARHTDVACFIKLLLVLRNFTSQNLFLFNKCCQSNDDRTMSFSKTDSRSAGHEISLLLRSPMVHYRVHKSSPVGSSSPVKKLPVYKPKHSTVVSQKTAIAVN